MSAPTCAKGLDIASIEAPQETKPNFYSASADGTRKAAEAKRLANLTARAALAGVTLVQIEDDRGRPVYVLTRWALTKAFEYDNGNGLDEVDKWLDRVAGNRT